MTEQSLNESVMPHDVCIGCGVANPRGFHATFFPDADGKPRIVGRFTVPEHGTGLPGIAQGGVLFTVLDCVAAWTLHVLRPGNNTIPATLTATVRYHKTARVGQKLELIGTVVRDGEGPKDPTTIHAEARDENGQLVAELESQVALLPPAKFKKIVGMTELPEDYRKLYRET